MVIAHIQVHVSVRRYIRKTNWKTASIWNKMAMFTHSCYTNAVDQSKIKYRVYVGRFQDENSESNILFRIIMRRAKRDEYQGFAMLLSDTMNFPLSLSSCEQFDDSLKNIVKCCEANSLIWYLRQTDKMIARDVTANAFFARHYVA